jgi:hypothetical protein
MFVVFAVICLYCDFNCGVIEIELSYHSYQEQDAEILMPTAFVFVMQATIRPVFNSLPY